jgi:hypothetical protein
MPTEIKLKRINLTPTMQCNLRCKNCGVRVPHYNNRPTMTTAEFSDTLKAVFEIVDFVDQLQITGGEPFLHHDLAEMIEACFLYSERFNIIFLFNNCAAKISDDVLETLKKHKEKVFVQFSDYGVKPDVANYNKKLLEDNDIPHRYLKYYGDDQYFDGWVDQGDFVKLGRDKETLEKVFSACPQVKSGGFWYARHGEMHWCGRSARGKELGLIPMPQSDYLNIFEGTPKERREKFRELQKVSFITACDYCNGYYGTEDSSKRIPAGEQMK